MTSSLDNIIRDNTELVEEVKRLKEWVNDLQSGMYINCVYCGHQYGPKDKVPCSMADVLKKHIEKCPKHPMSELKKQVNMWKRTAEKWQKTAKKRQLNT